jgi:hypothetical protein
MATFVVVEDSLRNAARETSSDGGKMLDDFAREINVSLKVLLSLLQGRAPQEGGEHRGSNLPTVQSDGSQSLMESSSAVVKASGSSAVDSTENSSVISDDRGPSRNGDSSRHSQLSSHKINRLHRIACILYGYRHKVSLLRQQVDSEPSLELHRSLSWRSMLHFTWDSKKRVCCVSALGVAMPCECAHSDGMRPFLSVSQSERALSSVLQMVESGSNVLLTGNTVRGLLFLHH